MASSSSSFPPSLQSISDKLSKVRSEIASLSTELEEIKAELQLEGHSKARISERVTPLLSYLDTKTKQETELIKLLDRVIEKPQDTIATDRKRSLPLPHSASDWKAIDLAKLNIHVIIASPEKVIGGGAVASLPARSARATALVEECKLLDLPHAVENFSVGLRTGADPSQDTRLRTGTGWVLLKYVSLVVGVGRMQLESVVHDFLIHLLVALGFNDGDLVVLSKNQLSLQMNQSDQFGGTADITVFDVIKRFRLVVMEDKRELATADRFMKDFEAQLVAEALAAAQANVLQQSKRRRAFSKSASGDASSNVTGSDSGTAGVIFLVRLVETQFSFYSVDPTLAFLEVFEDYSKLDIELPLTRVHKCQYTFPDAGEMAGKSPDERTFTEFNFQFPSHREVIIHLLDAIRLRIIE